MKSMKLWMGLAVAVALGTGCGGNYAEEACERAENISKEANERLSACLPDSGEGDEADMEACVEGLEQCSEEDVETALDWLDCSMSAFTCEAFENEDAANEALEKMAACDAKYDIDSISASCQSAIDEEQSPAVRKAMQLRKRQ
jgi:hypothetical protein